MRALEAARRRHARAVLITGAPKNPGVPLRDWTILPTDAKFSEKKICANWDNTTPIAQFYFYDCTLICKFQIFPKFFILKWWADDVTLDCIVRCCVYNDANALWTWPSATFPLKGAFAGASSVARRSCRVIIVHAVTAPFDARSSILGTRRHWHRTAENGRAQLRRQRVFHGRVSD